MASVSLSLVWSPCTHHHSTLSSAFQRQSGYNKFRICCSNNSIHQHQQSCLRKHLHAGVRKRRDLVIDMMSFIALPIPAFLSSNALAQNDLLDGFKVYTDEENKFKISVPQEWQVGKGDSTGFKSVTAFYPQENPDSNVSVVITGVGPDFTKMESFGKVEEFAETLVGGLDRSWQRPPGVAAKLIDSKSKNGFYYINYSLQNPGESPKYLYTAIGMALNGWYNRLYTVTGQFVEEESGKYGSTITKAVTSFRFI